MFSFDIKTATVKVKYHKTRLRTLDPIWKTDIRASLTKDLGEGAFKVTPTLTHLDPCQVKVKGLKIPYLT